MEQDCDRIRAIKSCGQESLTLSLRSLLGDGYATNWVEFKAPGDGCDGLLSAIEFVLAGHWHTEVESRAFADLAIRPNAPAVSQDYMFGDCQPQSGSIGTNATCRSCRSVRRYDQLFPKESQRHRRLR